MESLLWQLGGTTAAMLMLLAARWRERRALRRIWRTYRPAPTGTRPPTADELNTPEWIQPAQAAGQARTTTPGR